ncbi:MAG: hypothetical protein IKC49_03215 [Clostridia bacterium]|nr:hypothetical protein [Clostridia bacterium]
MIIVRYSNNDNIIDEEVSMSSAYEDFSTLKEKYTYVELIYIDRSGVEYCLR